MNQDDRIWPSDHRPVSEAEARGAISYMRGNDAKNTKGCVRHLCLQQKTLDAQGVS